MHGIRKGETEKMSRETMQWLNTYCLIGMVEKYGTFWHFDEDLQGAESNHYDGPIPLDDVKRRLFNWEPVEGSIAVTFEVDGNKEVVVDEERKAIVRPDTGDVFGVFKSGYQIHSYNEWLYDTIATILDDDELIISSAGLLRKGAQAWIQVETPETVKTPEGVEFRPHILGWTSLDGSLATGFGQSVINYWL
jgi:Domain of unknown function (DUF932)